MTCTLVITSLEASDKTALQRLPYIWYPVQFERISQTDKVRSLINSRNEINTMIPAYTAKQGFSIQKTSIRAQKIDGLALEIYNMVSASFLLQNSLRRV